MSRDKPLRVLCYDVSSDVRRRRIAKLLEDNASRVQFSVFETRLTESALNRIVAKIETMLEKGDSLRVYTGGLATERHCRVKGSGVPIESDANFWLL